MYDDDTWACRPLKLFSLSYEGIGPKTIKLFTVLPRFHYDDDYADFFTHHSSSSPLAFRWANKYTALD